jgi:fibronectin type 3 domain-containing protein
LTTFQAAGSISSCLVTDNLLKLDEGDEDTAFQKKAIKESAATAYGGEHIYIDVILSS